MHAGRLIVSIFTQLWLMDKQYAVGYYPTLAKLLENPLDQNAYSSGGNSPENDLQKAKTYVKSALVEDQEVKIVGNYGVYYLDRFLSELDGPAVVQLNMDAPVSRYDYCGDAGSMTYIRWIEACESNEHVKGIVLNIDSPGGQVSGTMALANAITNFSKPIVAIVDDGICASAAYWYGCCADSIWATTTNSGFGSIGAYASFYDFKEYMEERGIKLHEVYSRYSGEKNKPFNDALNGDYNALEDELDKTVEQFVSQVKVNRPIDPSKGDPFKGAMFRTQEAMANGLIDGITSINQVYEYILNPSQYVY